MAKTLKARDRKYVARDESPDELQVTRADGHYVVDEQGRRYLDFLMGWYVGNVGWGSPEIRDRIRRHEGPEHVAITYLYEPWVELAELIAGLMPGRRIRRSFRTTGGTEAVEVALQAAMVVTGRSQLLSLEGCYHGNSFLAQSVAGDARDRFGTALPGCHQLRRPLDGRAADRLETRLERRETAAFIMEPIVSALGMVIPEPDSEHFGLDPDIVCIAKGVSGGYGGLGAAVMTNDVADGIQDELSFFSTFGWHALAVEGAIGSLRYLSAHRDELLANVATMSDVFYGRLSAMDFGGEVQIRAAGLGIGIETGDSDRAEKLRDRCRKAGLLIGAEGGALMLFPALTIDRETVERGLDLLEGEL